MAKAAWAKPTRTPKQPDPSPNTTILKPNDLLPKPKRNFMTAMERAVKRRIIKFSMAVPSSNHEEESIYVVSTWCASCRNPNASKS
jgi:hypothetical protein